MPKKFDALLESANTARTMRKDGVLKSRAFHFRDPTTDILELLIMKWAGVEPDKETFAEKTEDLIKAYTTKSKLIPDIAKAQTVADGDITAMFEALCSRENLGPAKIPTVTAEELLTKANERCHSSSGTAQRPVDAKEVDKARLSTLKSLIIEWADVNVDQFGYAPEADWRITKLTNRYFDAGLVSDKGTAGRTIASSDVMHMRDLIVTTLGRPPSEKTTGVASKVVIPASRTGTTGGRGDSGGGARAAS